MAINPMPNQTGPPTFARRIGPNGFARKHSVLSHSCPISSRWERFSRRRRHHQMTMSCWATIPFLFLLDPHGSSTLTLNFRLDANALHSDLFRSSSSQRRPSDGPERRQCHLLEVGLQHDGKRPLIRNRQTRTWMTITDTTPVKTMGITSTPNITSVRYSNYSIKEGVLPHRSTASPTQQLETNNVHIHQSSHSILSMFPNMLNFDWSNANQHSFSSTNTTVPTLHVTSDRVRNVRFLSPLLEYGYRPAVEEYVNGTLAKKPLLLYLPGFDGTFISPFLQYPELGTIFDVRCLVIGTDDRSTFDELKHDVRTFLDHETAIVETKTDRLTSSRRPTGITAAKEVKSPQTASANNETIPKASSNSFWGNLAHLFLFRWVHLGGSHTPTVNATNVIAATPTGLTNSTNPSTLLPSDGTFGSRTAVGADAHSRVTIPIPTSVVVTQRRPFYLIGESFGAILAAECAIDIISNGTDFNARYPPSRPSSPPTFVPKTNPVHVNRTSSRSNEGGGSLRPGLPLVAGLQGLTMINPATCYSRSRLAMEGPRVVAAPPALYYLLLLGRLLPLFLDEYSLPQLWLILRGQALPSVIDSAVREAYLGRVAASLPFVLPLMTPGVLDWRLRAWLEEGSRRVTEARWRTLRSFAPPGTRRGGGGARSSSGSSSSSPLRLLLIAGEDDRTLPSLAEAERLASWFPDPGAMMVHVVEGAGHASTCGSRLDLAALMRRRFPELVPSPKPLARRPRGRVNDTTTTTPLSPPSYRTAMKENAAAGSGAWLGMESPRYDNRTVGHWNPLFYWRPEYYFSSRPGPRSRPSSTSPSSSE